LRPYISDGVTIERIVLCVKNRWPPLNERRQGVPGDAGGRIDPIIERH
jgi:hypothetical protein